MTAGMNDAVSPTLGDWHQGENALADQTSISIHVYGGNIGTVRRHLLGAGDGQVRDFVSGYANAHLPNLWMHEE